MARIAFIGVGNMGGPMTRNLLKAQHAVTAYDPVDAALAGRRRGGSLGGGFGGGGRQGCGCRRHHGSGGSRGARGLYRGRRSSCRGRVRNIADRLLDHRRCHRAGSCCRRRGPRTGDGRCAGLGRHRRSRRRHAHLHGRRTGRRPSRRRSRSWSIWARGSCIAARRATARRPRPATT